MSFYCHFGVNLGHFLIIQTDLKFVLVVRHLLSFGRDPHLNELGSDAGADDVRFTHVPHAEKEAQLT